MQKTRIVIPIIFGLLAVLAVHAGADTMSSANYRITTTVMSGGGSPMASSSYQLNGTLGQPSPLVNDPLMPPFSDNYEMLTGFWYTLGGCYWDLEPVSRDGDVDGADLAEFLNAFDAASVPSFAAEFGRIGCQ
jgi:hypothetical protein